MSKVFLTGGAGYVGCVLVPKLLDIGHEVVVFDIMIFGDDGLNQVKNNPGLTIFKGDLRNKSDIKVAIEGCDSVIHLASISNDPSADLDRQLTTDVNLQGTENLVRSAKALGVKRFINVSTSSVYGIKELPNVTEDVSLDPLTIYSQTKVDAEKIVHSLNDDDFCALSIRPATVCGHSPRMRLDLTVNILTHHAIMNKRIRVFGGSQKRPNIHIDDITDYYLELLNVPSEKVGAEAFNAGYENHTVMEIAQMVKNVIGDDVEIAVESTDDLRSYHISSEKIKQTLGFEPRKTIQDAIQDIKEAFASNKITNVNDVKYYNVKKMKALGYG